jgi:hypothetical protein
MVVILIELLGGNGLASALPPAIRYVHQVRAEKQKRNSRNAKYCRYGVDRRYRRENRVDDSEDKARDRGRDTARERSDERDPEDPFDLRIVICPSYLNFGACL